MTLKYLLQKEFLQIRRNAFLPRLIIMFPVMIMVIMPWVMNMEIKNIVVDVVDNDRSAISQQLVHRIEASNYFIFGGQKPSYQQALRDIEQSKADIIVEIPRDFGKQVAINPSEAKCLIAANAVNGSKGAIGSAYMQNVVISQVSPQLFTHGQGISTLYLYNKNLDYKVFMIPSLMAILMMLMCGFLPALNIVGEKESGTIEAINVTPVSKWSFILAKLIPYWIIGLVVMTISFLLAWAIYGITSVGPMYLVYLLAILLAFFFSGLGLVISNYNHTMQQAVFVMWFFIVIMLLMSGLFTPVRSMPHWAYLSTYFNPMHYFIDGIRTVFVRGGDIHSILRELLSLAAFVAAVDIWAVLSYKKNQ